MNVHSSKALDSGLAAVMPRGGFTASKVLVVGDLMLDRYVFGDVTRISPEAPVPVLTVRGQKTTAGGAANVVLNVAGLNATVAVAGLIGDDSAGSRLKEIFAGHGVDTSALVTASGRPTTCKTRVMSGNHQIVRMDEEVSSEPPVRIVRTLHERFLSAVQGASAVILSDYAKGVLGDTFTRSIIAACRTRKIPVLVDPKSTDYSRYSGATCVTPNLKEFKAAVGDASVPDENIPAVGQRLRLDLGSEALLVTRGADGMTLITREHSHHFPALAQEVFDVSGAGDTVIATIATALAAGLDLVNAAKLANVAASVVVRRAGTTPIDWAALSTQIFTKESRLSRIGGNATVPLRRKAAGF